MIVCPKCQGRLARLEYGDDTLGCSCGYRHYGVRPEAKAPRTMKRCPACKQTLPVDRFSPDAAKYDGRASYCRRCALEKQRHWRESRKGVVSA